MRPLASVISFFAIVLCSSPSAVAQERLFVDITEGEISALTLSVPDTTSNVVVEQQGAVDLGIALARILRADLATDPFFQILALPSIPGGDDRTLLRQASIRGTQALVVGRARRAGDGSLLYECAYHDVFSGEREVAREFRVPPHQWRRLAHKCADLVVAHATGYSGHFDTRFALISSGPDDPASPRRVIGIDFDGANKTILSDERELVSMPRLSPDHRSLLFLRFNREFPELTQIDLQTGAKQTLRLPAGLPSAPRFSPDGRSVLLALSQAGSTDIYEYELATGGTTRLTATTGIDTSPSYSPDGTKVVFESDRSGQPQLYVMQRDGRGQNRISFGSAHGSPAWSPDGRLIVFVSYTAGSARIGVMASDGSGSRLISEGPYDEDPVWAPSGRAIAFQRSPSEGGAPALFVVDVNGRLLTSVPLTSPSSEPDWSEILP